MPINPTESKRALKIDSPLGDELLCRSLVGTEHLGQMFDYKLDLLSLNKDIQFQDIVGQRVTLTLELDEGQRFFDGYVSEFGYMGTSGQFAWYKAVVKPWLWFLTRTSDCRIFQNQSVPDIIKSVFRDNGMSDFEDKLSGTYKERVYCVQYRETDYNFVSRLMEYEGIYYFWEHSNGHHKLILADSAAAHTTFPGYATVPFFPPDPNKAIRERDHIQSLEVMQGIVPGNYSLKDFDFEKPKVDLKTKQTKNRPHAYPISDHEIFDYPGTYTVLADGDSYVQKRLEELQSQHERAQARGTARGMCSGSLFTLENFPRQDQNKEYLIIAVTHDIKTAEFESSGGSGAEDFYQCHLSIMDSTQPYRSQQLTPKPIVQGMQSAIVVGPDSEEIYCDEYARVKVQFHWDRYGQNDQNSSCWVRVSQAWAGKEWGGIHIPRIGQEVLVSFLEGDPDQPLITGRVYNAVNMPPYDLEANKTQSGIKSRSSKGGTPDNFNELRFEDKKGKEEVYLQAEKNLNSLVKNRESRTVRNARTTDIGKAHSYPPPKNPVVENTTVHADRNTVICGNDVLEVAQELAATTGRKVTIHNGNHNTTVSMGNVSRQTTIGKVNEDALQAIEFKVGANSIRIDQMGITIKGMMINIEAAAITTIKGAMVKIN